MNSFRYAFRRYIITQLREMRGNKKPLITKMPPTKRYQNIRFQDKNTN